MVTSLTTPSLLILVVLILIEIAPGQGALINTPLEFVNLFIGTTKGGHTFPGATIPHGMVKVGMDTDSPDNHAGYDADGQFNVTGFSQLHQDGTGGAPPLSNFKIFPLPNCSSFEQCVTSIDERKILRKNLSDGRPDDSASPGYFATNLTNNVHVELTATRRTALHRYTFPASSSPPRLLMDITNDGQSSCILPDMIIDPDTGRIKASGTYAISFGPGYYKVFACMDVKGEGYSFDGPLEYGGYKVGQQIDQFITTLDQLYINPNVEHGGLLAFPQNGNGPSSLLVRVGVSFISTDQACSNAEQEIPDWDFSRVQEDAENQWLDILGRVQVDDDNVDRNTTELLYSSLYRTHLTPSNHTGENANWNSSEPTWDDFYCNWDTYRTLYPLYSLHDPENFASIVRGMVDIQKHEGWLPECREAGHVEWVQGGSNGDPIVSEFLVKFTEQASSLGVSSDDAYLALVADAENQPKDWNIRGRQADAWKQHGFVPSDLQFPGGARTKQVSRTLEYAFNDFGIAQVAKLLGKSSDADKYYSRASNFNNVWNANVTAPDNPSIMGFMQPRFENGTFNFTDPRHCSVNDPTSSTCFLNPMNRDGFYESSPYVYSQYVPQDTAKLIELQGGDDKFVERLDWIFDHNYFDSTDEPSQEIPHMYHYADRPGLSAQRVRQVITEHYNTSINGLPGNDDSGAMGSYVFFYLAGLYPVPATRQFLLSSPYFPEITFRNPLFNKTTTIRANNFDGNPANGTGGNIFVKDVTVNGDAYKSNCYLDWDVFEQGATVELDLTDDVNVTCGDGADALPPSLSTGGFD